MKFSSDKYFGTDSFFIVGKETMCNAACAISWLLDEEENFAGILFEVAYFSCFSLFPGAHQKCQADSANLAVSLTGLLKSQDDNTVCMAAACIAKMVCEMSKIIPIFILCLVENKTFFTLDFLLDQCMQKYYQVEQHTRFSESILDVDRGLTATLAELLRSDDERFPAISFWVFHTSRAVYGTTFSAL